MHFCLVVRREARAAKQGLDGTMCRLSYYANLLYYIGKEAAAMKKIGKFFQWVWELILGVIAIGLLILLVVFGWALEHFGWDDSIMYTEEPELEGI